MLAVYAYTMPRTISLEDAGLFQMVCHLGGISHPPGYPLFTSFCQATLPFFPNSIMAGNMLSAIFASLACGFFFSIVRQLTSNLTTGYLAALAYGFSATFWSQAIIIEVYTLAVLGFVVCWRLLLVYVKRGDARLIYITAFVYGLCLSNHWPLMLLSTPALILIVWPRFSDILALIVRPLPWVLVIGALCLGLAPYLIILAQNDATIAMLGDIKSLERLAGYIARSAYSDHHEAANFSDKIRYIPWLLGESIAQLGIAGTTLAIVGLVTGLRQLPWHVSTMLITMFLGSTLLLNMLLGFSFEFLWQAVFKPYPVIAYLALAFWFGTGLTFCLTALAKHTREIRWAPAVLAGLLVISVGAGNYQENNRRNLSWIDDYGRSLLNSLPENAVFFAADDLEVGVLGYLHYIEGLRPDVEIRNWENLVFNNRLASPFSSPETQQSAMAKFLQENERPVFAASIPIWPREYRGGYFRYTPDQPTSAVRNADMDPYIDQLLDLHEQRLLTDPHERHFAYLHLVSFTWQYNHLLLAGVEMNEDEMNRMERLQATFPGKLTVLAALLPISNATDKTTLLEMAESARENIPAIAPKKSRALLYEYLGRIALMAPAEPIKAIDYFEQSVQINPVQDNTSLCPLRFLYQQAQQEDKHQALNQKFPKISCG